VGGREGGVVTCSHYKLKMWRCTWNTVRVDTGEIWARNQLYCDFLSPSKKLLGELV
jgi:hypothetical protein